MGTDLQQIIENLDPEARECVEGIVERLAFAQIRQYTGKVILEMNFGQGSLFDSVWKEQIAGARKRNVRDRGIR